MKKILPTILIALIAAQILAPFSVGVGENNKPIVKTTTAEANPTDFQVKISPGRGGDYAGFQGDYTSSTLFNSPNIKLGILDGATVNYVLTKDLKHTTSTSSTGVKTYNYAYSLGYQGLQKGMIYSIQMHMYDGTSLIDKSSVLQFTAGGAIVGSYTMVTLTGQDLIDANNQAATNAAATSGAIGLAGSDVTKRNTSADNLPPCMNGVIPNILGCAAQLIYYVLFIPTSYIFALTGQFFDFTFAYSVNDASYRSPFVVEGWGIVRDFCNIFFIFVLLYVAFSTILSIHGFKTKEMIINVVIIGLLINFSLFASQVIIDASNILARVFYNSDAIKITQEGANGVTNATPGLKIGDQGEIPLSAALVNKVNPQKLIIHSADISVDIKDKAGKGEKDGLSAGTFILVTLLSVAVNVVGLIVFLSVGMMFIARVIGLWLAMIFVPLAFFSYTVPSMKGMTMVGWQHWWPETLKLAFLAPVFIFFLYLILKFLDTGLDLIHVEGQTGAAFVIATIVPFAFIMALLMKAKSIAKDMSGTIGQSITGAVAAVGGLALGGAALGAAALGRNTVGAFMKGSSTGDTAAQRYDKGESRGRIDAFKGRIGSAIGMSTIQQRVGDRVNRDQTRVEGYAHARHELDTAAGARFNGKKFNELTQPERNTVREHVSRDHEGENQFGKKYNQLDAAQKIAVDAIVAPQLTAKTSHADHFVAKARGKQGLVSSVVQSSRNGSYDLRNLSKLVAGEQNTGFNKFATGLTAALAGGMRGALKQANLNIGTGQKDFVRDLGHTITEALKSTTIKVDLSHVGEEKKEGGHGGGH